MKSLLLAAALTLLSGQTAIAQTNQNLESLCKFWGFLKYYHPTVAEGKLDWDAELMKRIEPVRTAPDKATLNKIYLNWLNELGEVPACRKCDKTNDKWFEKNFDLAWTDDAATFSPEVISRLNYIEQNRFQGVNHYDTFYPYVGNVNITNEINRDSSDYPAVELRLLALFRYWNIVNYFFPYKYQCDPGWETVLSTMIPKFINAADATQYHLALLEMVAGIQDTHANLVTDVLMVYHGEYNPPARFKFVEGKLTVTDVWSDSLAELDRWYRGDVVIAKNGVPVDTIFERFLPYLPASNMEGKRRNAVLFLLRSHEETAEYTVVRDGKSIVKTARGYSNRVLFPHLGTKNKESSTVKAWDILDGNIGYLFLGRLKVDDVDEAMKALNKCKGIVIDLRSGAQSTMYALAEHLHASPTPFARIIVPDFDYPGKFIWVDRSECGKKNKKPYNGKVVLLVNEYTQSHGEYTAMCLQSVPGVVTVGSQTAGADGNVSRFEIAGGYKTQISGIGIFYPDGTETQRVGVRIDVPVAPTLGGVRARKDEVLEKALEVIRE